MLQKGNKKKLTKIRIMAIGKACFIEKGYRETSITNISKESKVDRRTFYRYFSSKESLLIQITSMLLDEFTNTFVEHEFNNSKNAYEKILELFGIYFEYISSEPEMIILLGMIDTNVGSGIYKLEEARVLDNFGKKMDSILEKLISEGQNEGTIKKQYSPYDYALTINNALVALATRIAIYIPNEKIKEEGFAWKLLVAQGNIFLESLRDY